MTKVLYLGTNLACASNYFHLCRARAVLEANGFPTTREIGEAQHVILTTCAFNQDKEDQTIKAIQAAKRVMSARGSQAQMIVCGCLPAINGPRLAQVHDGLTFGGPKDIGRLDTLFDLQRPAHSIPAPNMRKLDDYTFLDAPPHKVNVLNMIKKLGQRANLPMALSERVYNISAGNGCLGRCSFCAIRKAHGTLVSRPAEEILGEFQQGLDGGFKQFNLFGHDVGAWGQDLGRDFTQLLQAMAKMAPPGTRIDSTFVNVNWIVDHWPTFAPLMESGHLGHFTVAVQHVSPRMLKLMNRSHDPLRVADVIKAMAKGGMTVAVELMVGFPEETDKDFKMLERFIEELVPLEGVILSAFEYQIRQGTPAATMKQVPPAIKARRIQRVNELFKDSRSKMPGKKLMDLVMNQKDLSVIGLGRRYQQVNQTPSPSPPAAPDSLSLAWRALSAMDKTLWGLLSQFFGR